MYRLTLCLLLACGGEESEPPTIAPGDPEAERPRLADEPASAWPTDLVALRASVDEFESLPSCEARLRARMPVELAETLSDLSYDAVLRDICIGLQAAKQADPQICDQSSVRTTREGCLRRLAIHTSQPDLCPSARGISGRDPLCVAWAGRAPRQCLALTGAARRTCEAVLRNDVEGCANDESCAARVARYGGGVATEVPRSFPETKVDLVVRRAQGATESAHPLDEGVHLIAVEGCAHTITLDVGELFRDQPRFRLEAKITAADATVQRARLMLPGGIQQGDLHAPTLTVSESRTRGDALTLSLRGTFRRDGTDTPVEFDVDTWIRDVDAPSDCPDAG